eukprot:57701-Rhodomonas_salina.1
MTAAGSLDMIEQLVPVGLYFEMTSAELEVLLRAGNLEEIACWIVELASGGCELRAPLLEQTVPLLIRTPAHATPTSVIWGKRVAQDDKHKL